MVETAIKQKAINYIETLDDEQTLQVITYIEKMPKKAVAKFKDSGRARCGSKSVG